MTPSLALVGLGIGGILAAAIAHELTHAAVAVAVGARLKAVDLSALETRVRFDADDWRPDAVGLSPVVIGLVAGVAVVASGWRPTGLVSGLFAFCAWFVYTFGGDELMTYLGTTDDRDAVHDARAAVLRRSLDFGAAGGLLVLVGLYSPLTAVAGAGLGIIVGGLGIAAKRLSRLSPPNPDSDLVDQWS